MSFPLKLISATFQEAQAARFTALKFNSILLETELNLLYCVPYDRPATAQEPRDTAGV